MANYSVLLILFVISYSLSRSSEDEGNSPQPVCPGSFYCSNLGYLSFPFYTSENPACGLCEVDCNQTVPTIQLTENYISYDLVQVMPGSSVTIQVRDNYFANQIYNKSCDSLMYRFPLNSFFISYTVYSTLTVLRCAKNPGLFEQVERYFSQEGEYYRFERCDDYNYYYTYSSGYISANTNMPPSCSVVTLPGNSPSIFPKDTDFNNMFTLLTSEFNLVLQVSDDCQTCHGKGGKCSNPNQEFLCEYTTTPNTKKGMGFFTLANTLYSRNTVILYCYKICF